MFIVSKRRLIIFLVQYKYHHFVLCELKLIDIGYITSVHLIGVLEVNHFISPNVIHWNGNVFILMKFSSLAALKVVKMTTSSAASDENFIKMTTFSFQCFMRRHHCQCCSLCDLTHTLLNAKYTTSHRPVESRWSEWLRQYYDHTWNFKISNVTVTKCSQSFEWQSCTYTKSTSDTRPHFTGNTV